MEKMIAYCQKCEIQKCCREKNERNVLDEITIGQGHIKLIRRVSYYFALFNYI
jgi:hypothetical protein